MFILYNTINIGYKNKQAPILINRLKKKKKKQLYLKIYELKNDQWMMADLLCSTKKKRIIY